MQQTLSFNLTDLKPFTKYILEVLAFTAAGDGNSDPDLEAKTSQYCKYLINSTLRCDMLLLFVAYYGYNKVKYFHDKPAQPQIFLQDEKQKHEKFANCC